MDMVVTFEDGSTAYLEHHGIKGMKWGVWNEETRARRMGGGLSIRKKSGSSEASSSGSGGYKGPKLTDEQKAIMKKAAIGLGTAAAIGGGVYLAKKAADAGLDAKLVDDLRNVRANEGARLRAEADIVKENIFRNALDEANQTKDGVNFKADRSTVNDLRKRATKSIAGTTRYFATRDNPTKARQNAVSFVIDGTDRGDVYRLVDATLNYKAASAKARANYAKGKKVVDTMFAAGRGAAIGTAVGTVLGTASNINAAKTKKHAANNSGASTIKWKDYTPEMKAAANKAERYQKQYEALSKQKNVSPKKLEAARNKVELADIDFMDAAEKAYPGW